MRIQSLIVVAIVLGVVSAFLRRKKVLGLTGMSFALAATLLGGASVEINETLHAGPAIGLDWFLLDGLLMTLIFSPIEVIWPAYPKQSVFRPEWLLDVGYFLSTHVPIQLTSFLILLPATQLTHVLSNASAQAAMASLPWLVAVRCWRCWWRTSPSTPSIARSTPCRSCGASMRSTIPPRRSTGSPARAPTSWKTSSCAAVMLVPMMFVFSQNIIVAYLLFVTIHATWAHCNFGPTLRWLEPYLVLPRFHHWHHTSQKESIDRNYAIHFPWIDKIFGTYYFPDEGVAGDLRPGQREAAGRLLGPDLLSVHVARRRTARSSASATSLGISAPRGVARTRPKAFITFTTSNPKSYSDSWWERRRKPGEWWWLFCRQALKVAVTGSHSPMFIALSRSSS